MKKKSKEENNENKQNNCNNIIKTNTLPIEQDPLFQKLYNKYNDGIDKYEFNVKQRIEKDPDFREFIARDMYVHPVVNNVTPTDEIISAGIRGDLDELKALHEERGISLMLRGPDNTTVCTYAVRNGNMEMLRWLNDHRCDYKYCHGVGLANQKTGDGRTLIHIAAECGNIEMLKYFWETFPQRRFTIVDDSGSNFLFYACLYKHVHVLKWASRNVAGVFPRLFEMKDKNGVTPLAFCKILNHNECANYIELRSKPEGEFHVKRLNKFQLAQKLGIKVEKIKAVELIQRSWRGYKGRQLAIIAHKKKNSRATMRLGLKSGLSKLGFSI